ncbi:MAG: zinc-ribbon domain-containing protein [Clostridiales Family XIII bacterium]|jgi:predicted RNA-binding Zn-ribbon protein involved in translation (DUF1610 family)|nr:zinc-ribbon domain-containing protein [Clostridiales Family XIII bacterium]
MSIFEDLTSKIAQTGQDVVQKTRDTGEVFQINRQISEEQKKAEKYFAQIGQIYYERFQQTADPVFSELIETLDGIYAQIRDYQTQIAQIKGPETEVSANTTFCTKCGKALPAGAVFCSGCGNPVSSPPAADPVPENSEPAPEPAAPETSAAAAVVPPVPPIKPKEKKGKVSECPSCQTEITSEMLTCPNCGRILKLSL